MKTYELMGRVVAQLNSTIIPPIELSGQLPRNLHQAMENSTKKFNHRRRRGINDVIVTSLIHRSGASCYLHTYSMPKKNKVQGLQCWENLSLTQSREELR
jgi:hypothetical protein